MNKQKTYIFACDGELYYTNSLLEREYIKSLFKKEVEIGNLHSYTEDLTDYVINQLEEASVNKKN